MINGIEGLWYLTLSEPYNAGLIKYQLPRKAKVFPVWDILQAILGNMIFLRLFQPEIVKTCCSLIVLNC